MEIIQFTGLNDLTESDQSRVRDLSSEHYSKIKRALKNITSLAVHIKMHKKEGSKHKFSVHVKAIAPTVMFTSTKAVDWDIARVMHKAFNDIEQEIKHRFHSDATFRIRK